MNPPSSQHRPRPQSLTDLYLSFTWLALQGFGGVLAIVQREIVEKKRWLTREEFLEDWAVAQIMPGPNVMNIALMLGGRHFGWRGALAALAGMLSMPLLVVLLIAVVYAHFADSPVLAGALRGMSAVSAGLICATGLKLFSALKHNPLGKYWCTAFGILSFVGIGLLRLPLIWLLPVLGLAACTLAYYRMEL